MQPKALVFAGMMAGLAALLQTAPVWFGEPAGYALAFFASLPAAVSAAAYPREAPYGVLAAVLLCLLVKPQEAWVLACTNGPFGLALGRCAGAGLRWWRSVAWSAATLLAGTSLLTWGVGVAALGPGLLARGLPVVLAAYAAFALAWAILFTGLFRLVYRRIAPLLPAADRSAGPGVP